MSKKINFAWPVTSEHAVVYQYFQNEVKRLKDDFINKRVVIFGAGIRGCCLLQVLKKYGFEHIVFCDNNPEKQGHCINFYDIFSLDQILQYREEQVILVSPENSEVMNKQLEEVGLVKGKHWFSFDLSVYDTYLEEYVRPVSNHVLIMGDCAFSHIELADEVTESLGDMMKNWLGKEQCKVLAMHGIGQQANYHICQSLLEKGERPSIVMLLVMEALTPKAHLMPRTQHPTLIKKIAKTIRVPNKKINEYAKLAEERFKRFQVESFASFDKSGGDVSEKLYMKMNYLFKLREETEGVVYLKKMIRMLNEEKISIILFIPPVNYVQGRRFFGDEFKQKYEENFIKLYRILDKAELEYGVIDASFLLGEKEFAATNTVDETSNYAGRSKLMELFKSSKKIEL